MKVLALLTALPLTLAGGCCIVSTTLSDGAEAFGTAEGIPSEACEGQWSDMACSEFEQAYGVKSISDLTNQAKSIVSADGQSSSTPSSSNSLPSPTSMSLETASTPAPSFAPIQIMNETSSDPPAREEGPKLSFRFADISGCGALRTCSGCTAKAGCMWSDSGCTRSTGPMEQWCSPVPRADTVKQACESLAGCYQCTTSAGCIWNRGICSYSRDGCEAPVNCANFAWQCPAENIPIVPWVQPGYGTYPPVGGQPIGGGTSYTYIPPMQQFGMSYTAGNLAVSASGYVAPPYVPPSTSTSFQTAPYQPALGGTFLPLNTISTYQPVSTASYLPPNSAQSYQPFAQQPNGLYPVPPDIPPSQLAVIGPLTPQGNTNSQFISQLLYSIVGPSPADASGLYPGAIVRPTQTNTVYSGAQGASSAQSSVSTGLFPSNTTSSSSSPQFVTSGLHPTSDFISASAIRVFSDSPAPTPSQQQPETLYSKRPNNRQLQLPDPLPNRQQNAAISQYDINSPSSAGELYQIAPLIDYEDFEQSSATNQQPTTQPISQSSQPRNPVSLYQPTNYIPFQYRPPQQKKASKSQK